MEKVKFISPAAEASSPVAVRSRQLVESNGVAEIFFAKSGLIIVFVAPVSSSILNDLPLINPST